MQPYSPERAHFRGGRSATVYLTTKDLNSLHAADLRPDYNHAIPTQGQQRYVHQFDGVTSDDDWNRSDHSKTSQETVKHTFTFWAIMFSLGLSALLTALEGTVITSALPTIIAELGGAQAALIEDTYARSRLDLRLAADRPQFFEAHGTGTPAGDPIEAEAIHRAIGRHVRVGEGEQKLWVGSVKTVCGHTEGTAGIAGLLKVCLGLRNALVPPNLLLEQLNPAIMPFYTGLEVPVGKAVAWAANTSGVRRASLNSFGFGGTNAHVIVENYVQQGSQGHKSPIEPRTNGGACVVPFTFSAATKASLKVMLQDFVRLLEDSSRTLTAHDLCYTLNARRSILKFRATFSAPTLESLKQKVQKHLAADQREMTIVQGPSPTKKAGILGVFTGQGAQWVGMGKELFQHMPFAQARLHELDMALATLPAPDRPRWSLTDELLADQGHSRLHLAEFSQPLCTALQIILVDLLHAANVHFTAVIGHSSGEIAAAYAAGVLSARDAIVLGYLRGVYAGLAGSNGAMAAAGTSMEDAVEIVSLPEFEGRLSVAAHNGPSSVTLSGDAEAVEHVQTMLADEGKFVRALRVDKAYHSHHMRPCSAPYVQALRRAAVTAGRPRPGCEWHSSVLRGVVIRGTADEGLGEDGSYWARNLKQTVLFAPAVENAVASSEACSTRFAMAVEVGPHGALRGPVREVIKVAMSGGEAQLPAYISCLSRGVDSSESFCDALGQIWAHSVEGALDLDKFQRVAHQLSGRAQLRFLRDLPRYPWDNKRVFWHESRRSRALRTRRQPGHPLLGTLTPDSTATDMSWHNLVGEAHMPWLAGHKIQGQTVFPAAGYVVAALEAGLRAAAVLAPTLSTRRLELRDVAIGKAMAFESARATFETLFSLRIDGRDKNTIVSSFRFHSMVASSTDSVLNASGNLVIEVGEPGGDPQQHSEHVLPGQKEAPSSMLDVDQDDFYSALQDLGYQYSMAHRGLTAMNRKMDRARGRLVKPDASQAHPSEKALLLHPGLLDSAFQALFLAYAWPRDGRLWSMLVPVSIRSVQVDVESLRAAMGDESSHHDLLLDSCVVTDGSVTGATGGYAGNVNVYAHDGQRGLVQVQEISIVPLAAAAESHDAQLFFSNAEGVAFPDAELAMRTATDSYRASAAEIELAWVLQRVSHYYLKRLVEDITPEDESRAEWYHKRLMDFARHSVETVAQGSQPYTHKEWANDSAETMEAVMRAHEHIIDVRLMRAVGMNLAAAVRGETVILQHMLKDGMLGQFYEEALGIQPYVGFLAEVVAQLTHINPNMRIIEIGSGTGSATKRVMASIGASFQHYTYTDISSGFFETAKEVFAKETATGKMGFQVLNAEQDITAQGFKEASYDVIVANLVLHATQDLEATLANIRRLLKPGGYLVMLESTFTTSSSRDQGFDALGILRLSFTMGGFEGWWLGAETGRRWTPYVSAPEWHRLLLSAGFSGVEASTPELDVLARPLSVLVSRCVGSNQHMSMLMSPTRNSSANSKADLDVVLISGSSLHTIRLVEATAAILDGHCRSMRTITGGLEALARELAAESKTADKQLHLSTPSLVLYMGDIDAPVFQNLSPEGFKGLKALFSAGRPQDQVSHTILWLTQGAACERPYANMSLGFCRALLMEQPRLRVQFMDYAIGAHIDAHVLAEDLLRLAVLADLERSGTMDGYLWPLELEIAVDVQGRRRVPRVVPHAKFNNCYNSSRRAILHSVDLNDDQAPVKIRDTDEGRMLVLAPTCRPISKPKGGSKVRSLYSASMPFWTSSSQAVYVNIGSRLDAEKPGNSLVLALSTKLRSIFEAEDSELVPYLHSTEEAPLRLQIIVNYMLATLIADFSHADDDQNAFTILVEPDVHLAQIFDAWAETKSCRVRCLTSSPDKQQLKEPFVYVHPRTSSETLLDRLPPNVSHVIVFNDPTTQSDSLAKRLQTCLPKSTRFEDVDRLRLHAQRPCLSSALRTLLKTSSYSVSGALGSSTIHANTVTAQHYCQPVQGSQPPGTAIIDWTSNTRLSLAARPPDMFPLLRSDATYLLVGLAGKGGGLGVSLAEYLVRQGARYIILTSRNPTVDTKMVSDYAQKGVRIEYMSNDATDEASLQKLVSEVRAPSSGWPRIAGVANGAMILNDVALENMTYAQMTTTLQAKTESTRILDSIFSSNNRDGGSGDDDDDAAADNQLDFFVLFSSLSCVFGREGQSNYDAANMYLIATAAARRARGLAASVIDIGAVMGVGYTTRELSDQQRAQLLGAGYRNMSERDFHLAFAHAISSSMAAAAPEDGGGAGSGELITGVYVAAPGEQQYTPPWVDNPRFAHVIPRRGPLVNGGGAADSAGLGGGTALESARELLKRARTAGDVARVIQVVFINKLRDLLILDAELANDHTSFLAQSTAAFGVDSLIAVEVQRWFMRDLGVDIPVLKILSDTTIQGLVDFAIDHLPDDLTPNLDASKNALDAITMDSLQMGATAISGPHVPAETIEPEPEHESELEQESGLTVSGDLWQGSYPSSAEPGFVDDVQQTLPLPTMRDQQQPLQADFDKMAERFEKHRPNHSSDSESIASIETPSSSSMAPDDASVSSSCGASRSTVDSLSPPDMLRSHSDTSAVDSKSYHVYAQPLSYNQSRFWFMSQLVADPSAFNVSCKFEIRGSVDTAALSRAVKVLGARHEALRTRIFVDSASNNGLPVQALLDESPLHLDILPSHSDPHTCFTQLHESVYSFEQGELMKIQLVPCSSNRRGPHYLLVGYHHINMDSSSLIVLMRELLALYRGEHLPAPRVQLGHWVAYQQEVAARCDDDAWEAQAAFWRAEFAAHPPATPIGRLEISPPPRRGARRPERAAYALHSSGTRRVSSKTAGLLRGMCRQLRATPFHVYTTVLQILVSRFLADGRDEGFYIGMADANRGQMSGAGDAVGNFFNLLPVWVDASLDRSFEALAQATRDKILAVMGNASMPFEKIHEQVPRESRGPHLTSSPIFQVFIDYRGVMEKLPWSGTGGDTIEGQEYKLSRVPYDAWLDIIDSPTGEASLELMVQDGLYTENDAARLLDCYVNMLDAFVQNSKLAARDVRMFNALEVQSALRMGQGDLVPLEHPTILPYLDEIVKTQPTSIALEDTEGHALSWADMSAKSKALAQALSTLGVASHARVGVFQEPSADWICSMLGVWRQGLTYVPLEVSQGMQRLRQLVAPSSGARLAVLVVHAATAALVPQLGLDERVHVVNISALSSMPSVSAVAHQSSESSPTLGLNDEAMLIYTSGSTGVPKGISVPHRVVVNAMIGMLRRWPMPPQLVLQQIALSFDMSWWTALLGLMTKGKVVIASRKLRGDARGLVALIAAKNITLTVAVPTETVLWLQTLDAETLAALRASPWRWHVSAGEPIGLDLLQHLQTLSAKKLRLLNLYGPTETMIPAGTEVLYHASCPLASQLPVPIGTIMANYTARVVDTHGSQPVPAGVPGQLVFGGAGIALGYVDASSLNGARFPRETLAGPVALAQGWDRVHMTGDRGYLREADGVFVLLGRMDGDTQVKVRGNRVDVREIEAGIVAGSDGWVSQAAVHVRATIGGGDDAAEGDAFAEPFLAAHVVLARPFEPPNEAARTVFLQRVVQQLALPSYMRPAVVVAVEALPLTRHGKLDRKSLPTYPLRDTVGSSAANTGLSHVATPTTEAALRVPSALEKMSTIWLDTLGSVVQHYTPLTAEADFFLVGGSSLSLVRVQSRLKSQHSIDVPLVDLFNRSKLGEMASLLDDTRSHPATAPAPAPAATNDDCVSLGGYDWEEETTAQPDVLVGRASGLGLTRQPHSSSGTKAISVALTGASGFLGRELLQQLVALPTVGTVHCLAVRDGTRLAELAASSWGGKMVIHSGDLALPNLGMPHLADVLAACDVVIHNGADTSFLKSYASVRAANLASAKLLVAHACARGSRIRAVHLVSTAGLATVLGRDLDEKALPASGPFAAAAGTGEPRNLNGYLISKWAAERYLEHVAATSAAAKSLDLFVHRPTAIVGPGAPRLDVMNSVLRFSEVLRCVPAMDALVGTFQFVSVEDVARDIVAAAVAVQHEEVVRNGNRARGVRYYNHCGDQQSTVDVHELGAYMAARKGGASLPLPVVSDEEWIARALGAGMPIEVAEYLRGLTVGARRGHTWLFPRAMKGQR